MIIETDDQSKLEKLLQNKDKSFIVFLTSFLLFPCFFSSFRYLLKNFESIIRIKTIVIAYFLQTKLKS